MSKRTTSQGIKEQLSAFFDGELATDELPLLLRQLNKQPELLDEAQKLHYTQQCISGEIPVQSFSEANSFRLSLHAAINAEETYQYAEGNVLVNQAQDLDNANANDTLNNASTSIALHRPAANDRFWKGFAGTGVAAAVAMLAINLWQAPTMNESLNSSSVTPVLSALVEGSQEQTQSLTNLSVNAASGNNSDNVATKLNASAPETYTVPRYVTPTEIDSTSLFLQPGDIQTVSLGNDASIRQSNSLLNDPSYSPFDTQRILIRMFEAESNVQNLMRENDRLRRQLIQQSKVISVLDAE